MCALRGSAADDFSLFRGRIYAGCSIEDTRDARE
jgi:hypothetical protein